MIMVAVILITAMTAFARLDVIGLATALVIILVLCTLLDADYFYRRCLFN